MPSFWCLPSLIYSHNGTSYSETHSVHVITLAEKSSLNNHIPMNTSAVGDVLLWDFHVMGYGEKGRHQLMFPNLEDIGMTFIIYDILFL